MARRLLLPFALVAALLWYPVTSASAAVDSSLRVSVTLPATLSSSLPLLRLHFSSPTSARELPPLSTTPALKTEWQQISPDDVQAVATSAVSPSTTYVLHAPTQVSCARTCSFVATSPRVVAAAANIDLEDQLLAQLGYLPLTFSPAQAQKEPADQVSGTFTWAYPNLPTTLSDQWDVGTDNVILRGALMTFQSQHSLPTTGEPDATTWNDLLSAANNDDVDPAPYNYVSVSMTEPETLTLYVAGQSTFHTLVNTGISVAPTSTGTWPVYLRYLSQTMSGTNPDGTHYSDPGIPDISYFNGGEALHGFIRYSYGFPQSLGCVEMPFSSAAAVWPHTPIGTLVTVLPAS